MAELSKIIDLQRVIETESNAYADAVVKLIGKAIAAAWTSLRIFDIDLFKSRMEYYLYKEKDKVLDKTEEIALLSLMIKMGYEEQPDVKFMNDIIYAGETAIGRPSTALKSNQDKIIKRMVDLSKEKLGRGASASQTVSELKEESEAVRSSAEVTARTVMNGAEEIALEKARRSDPDVIGYQWVSVLDNRTTIGCIQLNDQKFYYNRSGYKPLPPRHFSCRSTTIPIYKDNPEGEDIETMAEWIEEQETKQIWKLDEDGTKLYGWECDGLKNVKYLPKSEKPPKGCSPALGGEFRMALGETRYKLYKDGKLKIQRFTDLNGDELTLEELKRRSGYAWKRAGLDD